MRRHDDPRGQALVEFALAIPIVLLLMAGLLDLGRIVFINNSLSDGVRHGARHAIVDPRSGTYCAQIDEAVRSATRGQPLTAYTVTYVTISEDGSVTGTYVVCEDGTDGAGKAAMAANNTVAPGDRVTLEIGTDVDLVLGFIARAAGRETFNLEAESTMQVTFVPPLTP